jgi:hypothetical protein
MAATATELTYQIDSAERPLKTAKPSTLSGPRTQEKIGMGFSAESLIKG